MCDFSLHATKSRPAKVGETLVSTQFGGTYSSRGFASPAARDVAVCVLPGTELRFERRVEVASDNPFDAFVHGVKKVIGVPPKAGDLVATFIQVDKQTPNTHHDALEFPDGNVVKLHHLVPGQVATVLTLPAQPKTAAERAAQERVPVTA